MGEGTQVKSVVKKVDFFAFGIFEHFCSYDIFPYFVPGSTPGWALFQMGDPNDRGGGFQIFQPLSDVFIAKDHSKVLGFNFLFRFVSPCPREVPTGAHMRPKGGWLRGAEGHPPNLCRGHLGR